MENNVNNLDQPVSGGNNVLGNASSYLKNINLNQVPDQLKQFGTMAANKVKGLSTTQKVVGGALLLLGAGYLSRRSRLSYRNILHTTRP